MKNLTYLTAVTLAMLLLTACSTSPSDSESLVNAELQSDFADLSADAEVRLNQIEAELSQLADKSQKVAVEAQADFNAGLAELKSDAEFARTKLQKISADIANNTAESWQEIKIETNAEIDQLEAAWAEFKATYEAEENSQ